MISSALKTDTDVGDTILSETVIVKYPILEMVTQFMPKELQLLCP